MVITYRLPFISSALGNTESSLVPRTAEYADRKLEIQVLNDGDITVQEQHSRYVILDSQDQPFAWGFLHLDQQRLTSGETAVASELMSFEGNASRILILPRWKSN